MTSRFIAFCLVLGGCQGTIEPLTDPPDVFEPVPRQRLQGDKEAEPDVGWAPSGLLTGQQYEWAVQDLVGETPELTLPAENRSDLFVNNAKQHLATSLSEDVRSQIAQQIAEGIDADALVTAVGCRDDCNASNIGPFFRRAFRRTLPASETAAFIDLIESESNPMDGLRLMLEVLLQSPQFVYRFEVANDTTSDEKVLPADAYTVASRLSFFLWGSGPDDVLLDLAETGALLEEGVLDAQVDRMMSDDRFNRTLHVFHEQWLELHPIESLEKSDGFSEFNDMGPSWRKSLDATIQQSFEEGLSALLTSNKMVLSEDIAASYGKDPTGPLESYEFDSVERSGILTHPAMLAKLAYSDQDSPIFRGVFVMRHLLCQNPPDPPENADLTPPVVDPDSTTRERFDALTGGEPCVTCHQVFNPVGFLFSKFDAAGRFAEVNEAGRPLDSQATITGLGEVSGSFDGASDFATELGESSEVRDCVASQWMRYAIGRPVDERDSRSLYEANTAFQESSGDFRALMKAIAQSPAFTLYRLEEEEQ